MFTGALDLTHDLLTGGFPDNLNFLWRHSGEKPANDLPVFRQLAERSPKQKCGRLDLVAELGEAADDPITTLDRHLRRIHHASLALAKAEPGSWASHYWARIHHQLSRRRESLDVPWVSDALSSPGEMLWQSRGAVMEPQHHY